MSDRSDICGQDCDPDQKPEKPKTDRQIAHEKRVAEAAEAKARRRAEHEAEVAATRNPDGFKQRVRTWQRLRTKGFGKEHAFQRFRDHYGFNPTVEEWEAAITAIREGRALLVAKQLGGLEMWATEIRSIPVRLVFNRANQTLVTTNPPERRSLRKGHPKSTRYKGESNAE